MPFIVAGESNLGGVVSSELARPRDTLLPFIFGRQNPPRPIR